jgi:hypothetical protein
MRNCLTSEGSLHDGAVLDLDPKKHHQLSPFFGEPPAKIDIEEPHLALVLVVRDYVPHSQLWASWMDAAKSQGLKVSMYIHTPLTDLSNFPAYLRPNVIPDKLKIEWCHANGAIMATYEHIRKDPSVTHVATISDDTVPVKPLRQIYRDIKAKPWSRLCQDNNWWIPRAETWWALTRADLELFRKSDGKDLLLSFQRDYQQSHGNDCDDENFWYLPLKLRESAWGEKARILNECPMYTNWNLTDGVFVPCKQWREHAGACKCDSLHDALLTGADNAHPASFGNISAAGFEELLQSTFWFARKVVRDFQPEAWQLAQKVWNSKDDDTAGARA